MRRTEVAFGLDDEENIAAAATLHQFRAANVMGLSCVLLLQYRVLGAPTASWLQLELSMDQCLELAAQLGLQADIIQHERPTHSQ
jgi:hypothetical protein